MHTLASQNGPSTPAERTAIVEEFWASRNAWADTMNAERRELWEKKWSGVLERDLPPGHVRRFEDPMDHRVLPIRRRKSELQQQPELEVDVKVPGYRFYWQPKSLQIPLP
jgi:hypothetical protein